MTLEAVKDIFMDELDVLLEEDKTVLLGLWTQEASTEEEKKEIASTLRNSGYQFDKLRLILRQIYRKSNESKEKIGNPNFSERVAYEMGYQKAIRDVYRLIPKTTKE